MHRDIGWASIRSMWASIVMCVAVGVLGGHAQGIPGILVEHDGSRQTPSGAIRGDAPERSEVNNVLRFYYESKGAVLAAIWYAPADAQFMERNAVDLMGWLKTREATLRQGVSPSVELVYPVGRLADLARVAVVLKKKDKGPTAGESRLFKQRFEILEEALDVMVRYGQGPAGGIGFDINALAKDYPDEPKVNGLYVDYFRGLRSIAQKASEQYATLSGQVDVKAFREDVCKAAEEMEIKYIEKLYQTFEDTAVAPLAAIYMVKHYWELGKEGRAKALSLLDKHQGAWAKDADLRYRCSKAIGDILATVSGLKGLAFVDTDGKQWAVEDLRGSVTLFCFIPPRYDHIPAAWQSKLGDRIRVVAVPKFTQTIAAKGFVVVDPKRTDVAKLEATLYVGHKGLPAYVVVTPTLEVISGLPRVLEYLRATFPGTF